MNKMKTVKLIILLVALVLLIVSLATPEWTVSHSSPSTESGNMGLWQVCRPSDAGTKCTSLEDKAKDYNVKISPKMQATRSFSIIAVVAVIGAITCMYTCKTKPYLTLGMIVLAITSCAINIGLYVSIMEDNMGKQLKVDDLGYSFWLQVASICLVILALLLCLVKSKKKN